MESAVPEVLLTTAALKMPAEHNNLEQFVSKYFLVPFKGACERNFLPAESQRGICSCFLAGCLALHHAGWGMVGAVHLGPPAEEGSREIP